MRENRTAACRANRSNRLVRPVPPCDNRQSVHSLQCAVPCFFYRVNQFDLIDKMLVRYNRESMATIRGILETSLYVADVQRSAAFYESLFGLTRMTEDARFCALRVPTDQVLLLFKL